MPSPPSNQQTSASKGSLLVVFLTVFIDLLGFGIVLPLLPIYAKQFASGSSGWELGILMSSFSAMQFLFAPFWGRLSDSIGRRPVLMIGLAGSAFFYAMFGWATARQSMTLLFVSRFGAGIAGATISTAQAYIADCTSPENRSKGMALIGMAFGLGFTVGPLLGCLAVGDGTGDPSPWPGYVAAGLSTVALAMAFAILPESRRVGPGDGTAGQAAARPVLPWSALVAAVRLPAIAAILGAIFLCVFSFANFETTISMLISRRSGVVPDFAFSDRGVFFIYAFVGFMLALVQGGVVRRLAGKVDDSMLAALGVVIELCGFTLMIVAMSYTAVPLLMVALGVVVCGFAMITPALNSLLSRRTATDQQGSVMGVGQSINALARILGAGLGIPLLTYHQNLPYVSAIVLMAIGLALIGLQYRLGRDYQVSTSG